MNAKHAEIAPATPPPECPLLDTARETLANHPYFRGRAECFHLSMTDDVLVIEGTVPSFYLKQVLASLLNHIPGVQRINSRVDVVCPDGLSGCSLSTREQCEGIVSRGGTVAGCFPTCSAAKSPPDAR